jgi:serine/threonine protein kinase
MNISPGITIYGKQNEEFLVGDAVGHGSFGYVYKISRKSDETLFALKTIPFGFSDKEIEIAFRHEGTLAVGIDNPHVVKYDYFHDGAEHENLPPYIIMEFANSGTLFSLIKQRRDKKEFFDNKTLLKIFGQLIYGMKAINSKLVHRDIKPDNILIHDGALKISDFGLAKVVEEQTRTSTLKGVGHIEYMAPEGWVGEKNTVQMDIYSMGVVFYELSTLVHPFKISSTPSDYEGWKRAHLFLEPDDPRKINSKLPQETVITILKMMGKKVKERCKTWEEVEELLEGADHPLESDKVAIDDVVNVLLEMDMAEKQAEAQRLEMVQRRGDFFELVNFQFERDILKPIEAYSAEVNKKFGKARFRVRNEMAGASRTSSMLYKIDFDGLPKINIEVEALFDFKITEERLDLDYGQGRRVMVEKQPTLKGKLIRAWGIVKNKNGIGFNLFLVEGSDPIYGEWIAMFNTNSALNQKPRLPEPFPFAFKELPDQLEMLSSVHIYVSQIEPLTIDLFTHLLKSSIQV